VESANAVEVECCNIVSPFAKFVLLFILLFHFRSGQVFQLFYSEQPYETSLKGEFAQELVFKQGDVLALFLQISFQNPFYTDGQGGRLLASSLSVQLQDPEGDGLGTSPR
jgi:hypothetical protein